VSIALVSRTISFASGFGFPTVTLLPAGNYAIQEISITLDLIIANTAGALSAIQFIINQFGAPTNPFVSADWFAVPPANLVMPTATIYEMVYPDNLLLLSNNVVFLQPTAALINVQSGSISVNMSGSQL
jgi:hypothetical protein